MPFYVTVKQPYTRIIRSKPQHNMSVWSNENSIASHGCWMWVWSIAWVVETCVIGTAGYHLEDVAMEMERVFLNLGSSRATIQVSADARMHSSNT